MDKLKEHVKAGDGKSTAERVQELLDGGTGAEAILKESLIPAMDDIGELYSQGEFFVPEMLASAKAMKEGMQVLRPRLAESGVEPVGKVVLGTVKGDLHDIGKNLVGMVVEGAGFEIVDLGTDVATDNFIAAVKEHKPVAIGMSALLTTTMGAMQDVIDALKDEGLRDDVKVMIGGAPLSQEFADEIGADFFGRGPADGKDYLRKVSSEAA